MTTEPTPLVTALPCEADMIAAAEYVAIAFGERYRESVLNEGRWPDLAQAFARHRLAALEAAAKVAEEASGPELPWSLTEDGAQKAARSIATAIRALSNKGGEAFSRPTDPSDAEWAFWLNDAASILQSNGTETHADCAREAATRVHWLHERSTDIANRFGQVAIEKLNTGNMTRAGRGKHGLNRSILEQGWAMFADMLEYKLADRGGVLHYVNPAYTSQTCSCCGSVNAESRKSQAVFECVDCGHRANADTNAAINILRRSPAGVEGAGYGPVEARTGAASRRRKNPHGYVSGEAEPNSVYG